VVRAGAKESRRGKRTKAQISFNMSRVRSSGSAIEKRMQLVLRQAHLRAKKQPKMFGRPDFVIPGLKIAIFCDSHFWHGYRWKTKRKEIRRNRAFWISKILGNMRRDRIVNRRLRTEGWIVLRFWEHQIVGSSDKCLLRVKRAVARRENGI
jgi:DNA mismatch endonuclease Vsr